MKKVFGFLSVVCIGLAVYGCIADLAEGSFGEDTMTVVLVLAVLAGIFGYLAWVWRISPVKRAKQQAAQAVNKMKENSDANKELTAALKKRMWKFRIWGALILAVGLWIMIKGYGTALILGFGTVVLIIGMAVWMMGSPADYNSMTDVAAMIPMDKPRKIEEFYEAFKNVKTPLGSGWLGRFYTMSQEALVFGPDERGEFFYFWLTKDGIVGYLGYSFLDGLVKERINEPIIPPAKDFATDVAGHLCYHSDFFMCQSYLKENLERFVKTGQVEPFRETLPSEVYTFTENFKLTGQHFELRDKDDNLVYEIDGTVPLISLYIYDNQHQEVFKLTKEIGHMLATYRFYLKGEPYGVLEKQFTLVRDKFAMQLGEDKLELTEYAGTIGHNFNVTINGRMIGAIMDNMDITIGNVLFDNAFLIAYEKDYLPLLTAMAVMVARELARDEDGGLTNR